MSNRSYRVLADENVERKAARYLESAATTSRWWSMSVGPGVTDEAIVEYATRTDRLVLTGDDDFLSKGYPTLFQEDGQMSAFRVAGVVDAVADAMSQSDLEKTGGTKLVEGWL